MTQRATRARFWTNRSAATKAVYYGHRAYQKLFDPNHDFRLPFRRSSHVCVSSPPGSVLKFASRADEPADLEMILGLARPGMTYFDVGANFGHYALAVHDALDGRASIHCFEPEWEAFRRLLQNRRLNGATWQCNCLALGEGDHFAFVTTALGGYNHMVDSPGSGQPVKVTALDTYCKFVGVDAIDLLKIDVEGFELMVLRGARELLERGAIGHVVFEVEGHEKRYGVQASEYSSLLEPLGYHLESGAHRGFQLWSFEAPGGCARR